MIALLCLGLIAGIILEPVILSAVSPKIDCNDGGFYIRADPENCSNFYKCDNGNPVLFHCPSGLYFNPTLFVCDWPRNVKCVIPNSGSSQQYTDNNGQQYSTANGGSQQYNVQTPNLNQELFEQNDDAYSNSGNNYDYQNNPDKSGYNYKPYYTTQESGDHNNNDQLYKPVNSGSQQYNGYDTNQNQDQNFNNQDNNNMLFPVQPVETEPTDTAVGPSIQSPTGPLERPRPTVDQLVTANGNPYQDYLSPEKSIDIR